MKKLFFTILMAVLSFPSFAGTKLVFGSMDMLLGEKNIPVILNWDKAVYAKYGNIEDFIAKAPRDENWEALSMNYFLQEVNDKTLEFGTRFTSKEKGDNTNYRVEIVPESITKGGDIKGEILVYSANNKEPIATISFSSDESDDNDKIAFKDQLENIGENFGKLLKKSLKQASKEK